MLSVCAAEPFLGEGRFLKASRNGGMHMLHLGARHCWRRYETPLTAVRQTDLRPRPSYSIFAARVSLFVVSWDRQAMHASGIGPSAPASPADASHMHLAAGSTRHSI